MSKNSMVIIDEEKPYQKKAYPKTPISMKTLHNDKLNSAVDLVFEFDFSKYKFLRMSDQVRESSIKNNDKRVLDILMRELEQSGYLTIMQGGLMYSVLICAIISIICYKIIAVSLTCLVICLALFGLKSKWQMYLWGKFISKTVPKYQEKFKK